MFQQNMVNQAVGFGWLLFYTQNSKKGVLNTVEKETFFSYMYRRKRLSELATEFNITSNSAMMKIYRIKKKVYSNFLEDLVSYTDESILELEALADE